jgi:hypothetical protein
MPYMPDEYPLSFSDPVRRFREIGNHLCELAGQFRLRIGRRELVRFTIVFRRGAENFATACQS